MDSSSSSPTPQQKHRYRVVVMGAAGVGKTSILTQFLYQRFVDEYHATVEEMYTEDYLINGMDVTLDFLDTAGSYEFPAMRKLSIQTADAFILVYSVDDEASYEEVANIREQILVEKNCDDEDEVPIVIVGNKADCDKEKRQVQRELAETTANIDWDNGYVEASAKENVNVSAIFRELLRQVNVSVTHNKSMLRRWDSAPIFSELPEPSKKQDKASLKNGCRIS